MTLAELLLPQHVLDALGLALLHFLWQGALIALVYAAASFLLRESAAHLRYVVACAALALMFLLPMVTAGLLLREAAARETSQASRGLRAEEHLGAPVPDASVVRAGSAEAFSAEGESGVVSSPGASGAPFKGRLAALLPWLVGAWMMGVGLLALRLLGGWVAVRRMRVRAEPVAEGLQQTLTRLAGRLRVSRPVRLCESALVVVPSVVGWLRPVILVPASALTGLTPQQFEALLAHELAHVRRYDYLVNLLQTLVETLLFYHPATWWVSRCVRLEREHACDDLAVEATGDVLSYARALAALENLRRPNAHALALAADGGSLMKRIRRLLLNGANAPAQTHSPLFALALILTLACTVFAGARALVVTGDGAEGAGSASRAPAAARREVAFTFVAFPGNGIHSNERLVNKTRKLMRGLAANKIEAVGFVNERSLYKQDGMPDEERVALLGEWLDAGHELGNETYSHRNLFRVPLEEFKEDVVKGEKIMGALARERGKRLRYFSYPYLNTGPSPEVKEAAAKFLRERGYQIHPVTVDNMDWLYSHAYLQALRREDEATMATIRAEYVTYLERMFEFYEGYSREVVGREFPQVLMLTAGALNADTLEDVVAMLKRRGYSFVTMEQAMKDAAYSLPENFVGEHGDSWIARWAASKGMGHKDAEEVNLTPYAQKYYAEFLKERGEKPKTITK